MKLLQGIAFTGSEGINSKEGYMGLCFLNLYYQAQQTCSVLLVLSRISHDLWLFCFFFLVERTPI